MVVKVLAAPLIPLNSRGLIKYVLLVTFSERALSTMPPWQLWNDKTPKLLGKSNSHILQRSYLPVKLMQKFCHVRILWSLIMPKHLSAEWKVVQFKMKKSLIANNRTCIIVMSHNANSKCIKGFSNEAAELFPQLCQGSLQKYFWDILPKKRRWI